ncbi:MAG: hypothetical protein KIT31_37225 [Deltaproteobacteria bacterium]|nr:hypothetical protein [Deltaproteobacteria bacterium]
MKGAMLAGVVLALAACDGKDVEPPPDAVADPDPLRDIQPTAAAGSLDQLHEKILARRCSGQPGLCHNGQFEPNLSTAALTYEYLVNRPGIEKGDRLRVKPGSAANSLFIDKIRNRGGVATQMPLGAEPLEEADIQALERWIDEGALRRPGADPAPNLNNPPKRPEIGFFTTGGARLDGAGPVRVNAGSTVVLRHTVSDFETPDSAIPFAAVVVQVVGQPKEVVLEPGSQSPQVGPTTFDGSPSAPQGKGDKLNFARPWPITNPLQVRDQDTGAITAMDPRGKSFQVLALYIDAPVMGIVALDVAAVQIEVNP